MMRFTVLRTIAFGLFLSCACILSSGTASWATAEGLYESRLDKGLFNTEPYSYLLIEMAHRERDRSKELLTLAKRYSPDLPPVYFELAGDSLSPSAKGVFQWLDYVRQGITAYGRNFWWQFTIAGLLYASLVLSFLFSLLLILIIRLPAEAGLIFHDGTEDWKRLTLLGVPIILSFLGPIGFLSGMIFLAGLYFKKENKVVAYVSLLFFLASPALLSVGEKFFSAPSPDLRALVAVNEGKDNTYALTAYKGKADFVSRFSYALALKREGRYQEAIEVYKGLTDRNYRADPRVYINLGNAYYASGDAGTAKEFYQKSLEIYALPAAFYDLSQIHRAMLDFAKGDEYFLEAAKLDPRAVTRFTSAAGLTPNRFVVDETLPTSSLWKFAMTGGGDIPGTYRILTAVTALLAIAGFYLIDRKMRHRAHRCKRCGSVFCGKCSRVLTWGDMCPRCYRSLIKIDEVDSRERVSGLLSIYQSQTMRRRIARVISYLIPGGGQIYSGRILAGLLFLWPFLFALMFLVLNAFHLAVIFPFSHSGLAPLAILFAVIIYTVSVLDLRRRINRGWL